MSKDTDNNGTSYATPETWRTLQAGRNYDSGLDLPNIDDVLKIHKQIGLTIQVFSAGVEGKHIEDGIDAQNRNAACTIEHGFVGAGRKGVAITNKGGNRYMSFRHLVITKPGRIVDIEDGNHSDQCWDKTTRTIYDAVSRADGKPVRYAWGRADRAELLNGNYKIVWWWTIVLHVYVYAKHYLRFIP